MAKNKRKEQIRLWWSKREGDWMFDWPDAQGKDLIGVFFDMVKITKDSPDYKLPWVDVLAQRGYDYTTFKITCEKLPTKDGNNA